MVGMIFCNSYFAISNQISNNGSQIKNNKTRIKIFLQHFFVAHLDQIIKYSNNNK